MADTERGRERERSPSREKDRGNDRSSDRGSDRDDHRESSRGRDRPASRPDDRGPGSTASVLVRNISYRVRADDLRTLFSRYGEVRDVYIPQDFFNKRPRGFAFIEFYDRREAETAVDALDRHELEGREINVVFAKDRRKTSDEMKKTDPRSVGGRDHRGRGRDRSRSRSRDRGGDYGRRDNGGRDYGDRDYGRKDYGGRDYGNRDYGGRDYGREDRYERRRSPSPARRRSPSPDRRRRDSPAHRRSASRSRSGR